MNHVESIERENERVCLVEFEGVSRLEFNIHSHNIEPGPVITHRRSTSPAKKIEQSRPHSSNSSISGIQLSDELRIRPTQTPTIIDAINQARIHFITKAPFRRTY
jgi:hypothetical protein